MNILFWNTCQNTSNDNIDNCLPELIMEKQCDLVVLAEYENNLSRIMNRINSISREEFALMLNNGGCDRIKGLIKKYREL